MKDKIAIIFTTFLRDKLMYKTVQSIIDNWQDNYVLLIGDQNKIGYKGRNLSFTDRFKHEYTIYHYDLPYDCGLSYARNYLVDKAHEMGIKYCLVTADSLIFTKRYDFTNIIEMLDFYPKLAKIGFSIKDRQNFTYDLEISRKYNKFIVIKPRRQPELSDNIEYTPCDLCCNFFMGKTAILKEIPWDNELKLAEHEDHCYRLKQAGYKTLWTPEFEAEYINEKPDEYKQMRNRLYSEFKIILKKKYNLDPEGSWLIYNHKLPKKDQL